MPAVGDANGSHRFTGLYTGSESQTSVWAPFLSRERVLGSWLALRRLWGSFGVVLGELCRSLGEALGSHWGRNRLPINTLWGGFGVAWRGCIWGLQIADGKWRIARPVALFGFSFQLSAFQLLPDCGFGWLARSPASISAFYFLLLLGGGFARLFKVRGSGFRVQGSVS